MESHICHVIFLLIHLTSLSQSVNIPPKITFQSNKDLLYKVNETVKIDCEASGSPHPSFSWKRQEIDFNPAGNDDRITQVTNKGTLIINSPEDKDEGIYQCFAKNELGRAVSVKFNLRMAKLDTFKNDKPTMHRVELGGYLRMSCQSPDSVPDSQIYWVVETKDRGFHPVDWNSTVSMDYEDRIHFAHVTALNAQDGQPYRCNAYNSKMRSNQVGPPHYIIPTGTTDQMRDISFEWPKSRFNQFGLVGSVKKLKCIFAGNPTPIVRWRRGNNAPFSKDRVILGNSDGQELVINNLQFEDAGSYVCEATAEGSAKPVQMSFNLTVNSSPTWLKKPKDLVVGKDSTATFECSGTGVPEPQIFWFVNGQSLEVALGENTRLNSRFKRLEPSKIVLEKVTTHDAMVFQCNVTNIHGYVWGEAYLNVFDERPTILGVTGSVVTVAERQPFELKCAITGKPDPIITWYKNGTQITGGRYVIRETGNLFVTKAVLSDAGVFTCEAVNRKGRAEAVAGTVIVRRKTLIEQSPKDLEVKNEAYAKFTCSGTTDPEEAKNLRVIWLKDYKTISVGQRFFTNKQDNSLILSGALLRDTGTVTCVLTNGIDNDTASARLEVTDIPDRPTDLKIVSTCMKHNLADLVWVPGSFNNAPIQYFIVEYTTTKDPDNWSFANKTIQTKSKSSIQLSSGLDYTFRVISVNKVGMSSPSLPTTTACITEASIPLQHPRNVRTIGDLPGKIHLEWTPVLPKYQGGRMFYYTLTVKRVGIADGSNLVATDTFQDWKKSSAEIPGISLDYEPYEIILKSINEIGEPKEDVKPVIGHSGEAMPLVTPSQLVTKEMTDDSVTFQWEFPRVEIGRLGSRIKGEFKGFQVQIWEKGNRPETIRQWMLPASYFVPQWANATQLQKMGNIFEATVRHILPNTKVGATVAVVNNFFIGRPSEVIYFQTMPGLPGPVKYMDAEVIGDNHITIKWERPLDDRAIIIGYDIGFQRVVRGLELDEMQEVQPSIDDEYATNAMVDGLLPLTKYRIHLWAKTKAGRGESYFIERTTSAPRQLTLPRFSIVEVGETHINVSWWTDVFATSGSVVYVEYKKEDSAEWFSTTPDVSRTWADITFLQPGMTYLVRVVVTNGNQRMASIEEDVDTDGNAAAYDVVENLGWFLAIIFSLLFNIALIVLLCIGYKRGYRCKSEEKRNVRTYKEGGYVYTDTDKIGRKSEDFGPEPQGHSNDYYGERDSYDYRNQDEYDRDRDYNYQDFNDGREDPDYYPNEGKLAFDDYEDYDTKYDNRYDDDDEDLPVKPAVNVSGDSWDRRRHSRDDYDDHDRGNDHYDDRDRRDYDRHDTGRGRYPDNYDDRYYDDDRNAPDNNGRHANRGYHRDSDGSDHDYDRPREEPSSRGRAGQKGETQGSTFV